MKFARQFLIDGLDDEVATVSKKITGRRRWVTTYRRVFRHDGKFYETYYDVGSTEQQDQSPYEYEDDEIECAEVFPVERTVTFYESAKP